MFEERALRGIEAYFKNWNREYVRYGDVLIVKENGVKVTVGFDEICDINAYEYLNKNNLQYADGYCDISQQVSRLSMKGAKKCIKK